MTNFPEVKDATEIIKKDESVLTINHTYEHINKKALRETWLLTFYTFFLERKNVLLP